MADTSKIQGYNIKDANARENITLLEEDIGNLQEDISNITDRIDNYLTITPTLQSGTKIADYEIEGVSGELYAPSGSSGSGIQSVTGTNSASVTTDSSGNATVDVSYITTGKASGSTVGMFATAEGTGTTSSNIATHAEGTGTQATNTGSHSEGGTTVASGMYAHAEGDRCSATSKSAHAEGEQTTASGANSHAEGVSTTASGAASHAEGRTSQATGLYSHAEGDTCVADANYSHAEGSGTTVPSTGVASHSEGLGSTASGANGSHAGGNYSQAIGNTSFAHGDNVIANNSDEVALGKFNVSSTTSGSRTVFSIGNGVDNNNRSNLFEIKENGTVLVNGVAIGGTYVLPVASASTLGGVKVGSGLSIAGDGTLSATGGSSSHTYSTTEQVVGTWIDGKPVYEKTLSAGNVARNGSTTVSISDLNIAQLVDVRGTGSTYADNPQWADYNTFTGFEPIPLYRGSGHIVEIHTGGTLANLVISLTSDYMRLENCYVTLRYTKTTD